VTALRRALAAGSLSALAIDLWMLAGPGWGLTRDTAPLGAFYDVQARAFLDGHLAVPASAVGFEGFEVDGATYIYYGPVLALLRLPLLLVTHRLDGRLTQLSMLLALVVLLVAGCALYERVRGLLRPAAAVTRGELALAFMFALALGAGSVALYLAATPAVYEETELWGAALGVAAFVAIVAVVERPTVARVLGAGLLATLTVNTRVSVGLGPIVALAVLGVAAGAGLAASRGRALAFVASFGPRGAPRRAIVVALTIATLVPLVSSAAVNQAKFDRPFGLPMDKQVATRLDANRRAALAANDGTIFGPQFVPTTLLAAARPDAVGSLRAFPFVGLPAHLPHVVGDVRFDTLQRSLSAPTSMPLLCLLTLVALAGLARRAQWRPVLAVLVAAATGYVGALTIAYVTTRYLADLLPFLALGAVAGLQVLLARGVSRRVLLWGAGALVVVGLVTNGATGLVDQRLVSPLSSERDRAAFVRAQDDVDRFLGRRPAGVRASARLPATAPGRAGDLLVLGRCDGLYAASAFGRWLSVERTPATGYHVLRLRDPAALGTRPRALLTDGAVTVDARRAGDGVVFGLAVGGRRERESPPVALPRGATVVVSFDEAGPASPVWVRVGGRNVVGAIAPYRPGEPYRVAGDVAQALPVAAPVCSAVAERAGLGIVRRRS
jgi:hypothetical protein